MPIVALKRTENSLRHKLNYLSRRKVADSPAHGHALQSSITRASHGNSSWVIPFCSSIGCS
ncbi:hypothetical protein PYCCODRAFT_1435859 [Trametes coccinea BRFM310]|uniref:Uncharacterized protein n=1 Tax=Trametes coccinea (strain BRFM310) TaxID=1353009 RepID=A0A1Y2IM53_TRAC3|nr:hypothetical protein PYCCODRAFT_1435859 [Trametes coccinea BRFM310]